MAEPFWQHYPCPAVGLFQRTITIAQLPKQKKQRIWAGIKKQDPALADLLQNDRTFSELKTAFDAAVVFTQEEINGFIDGG